MLFGQTYGAYLANKIFKPLGMTRAFNDDAECYGAENVAQAYMTLDDTSAAHVPRPYMADGTLMNAAGGIQSCVKDLLKYYATLMKAANDQFASGKTSTEGSLIKQVAGVLSSKIKTSTSLREQSYACGWVRAQLPRPITESRNQGLISPLPVIGNPENPRLLLCHGGMLVGFTSSVYLFPETETAIILLSNSVALNDGPAWIGQLIMQTLYDDPVKHDFVQLARDTAESARNVIPTIKAQLKAERGSLFQHKPLDEYVGRYFNKARTFYMHIARKEDELWMNLQGNEVENYQLHHYNGDVFM